MKPIYRLKPLSIVFLLTVILAACSPALVTSGGKGLPTSTPAGQSWTLTYNHSGGLAGIDQTLIIHSDGSLQDGQGQKVNADQGEISALVEEVNGTDFTQFQADYSKGSRCNDCFTTTLTLEKGGITQTIVIVEDGSVKIPAELESIIQKISEVAPPGI